jgi:dTDP-L-rhamnose 4-epimerase
MNYLITGGAGFIGSHLSRKLLSLGASVTVIDTLDPQIHGHNPNVVLEEGVKFVRMSVVDMCDRIDLVESADVVVHLAAQTGTGQSMYDIRRYVNDNELGTAALLEAVSKALNKPQKIVLSSSRSIYGEGAYLNKDGVMVQPKGRSKEQLDAEVWDFTVNGEVLIKAPTPESIDPAPASVYAATKLSQEYLLTASAEALGVDVSILRFQNVYGEGQSLQNPYTGIISIFFNRARQGLGLSVFEDGNETRDFVHVDDVVDAMLAVSSASTRSTIFNVGSGVATSVNELVETLLDINGFECDVKVTGQYRLGDIRHNYADLRRIREEVNFKPLVDLRSGLARFSEWALRQPEYVDRSDMATKELVDKGLGK